MKEAEARIDAGGGTSGIAVRVGLSIILFLLLYDGALRKWLLPGSRMADFTVGDGTALGASEIELHDQVTIGSCVVINDGAVLLTASHSLAAPQWAHKKAPIVIGDYAWIAPNAIIFPRVPIGRGSVVGAGAVVRGDVSDYGVVAGNPATLMSRHRVTELSYWPALLNAPFEAWVGAGSSRPQPEKLA